VSTKPKKSTSKDREGELRSKNQTQQLVEEYQRSLDALVNYQNDYAIRRREISARESRDPYY
jgi:lipopolysaccharide biosynthesis regulator YciM